MKNEIDINNEEQILKECNFNYFYNCEECSEELCSFYNTIQILDSNAFDCDLMLIDLGRIAITLNEQNEKIKEQEKVILNNNQKLADIYYENLKELDEEYLKNLEERIEENQRLKEENQQLKQSQNQKAIEVLEEIFELFDFYRDDECEQLVAPKEDEEIYFLDYLKDKLTELKGAK